MRIIDIPNHVLIQDDQCINISVTRSAEPDTFLMFPTNLGHDYWLRAVRLVEGPSGQVERAEIESVDGGKAVLFCTNRGGFQELFQDLLDHSVDSNNK